MWEAQATEGQGVRADRIGAGNVITAYGSSGIKGPSGVEALGGLLTDPGAPRTATWLPGCRSNEVASTMRITIDDAWTATVAGDPLDISPRFDFRDFRVRIAPYANVEERGQFLLDTFGSEPWLWDTPDELRFDQASPALVGAEFRIAGEAADAEDSARLRGLRAGEARDFRLEALPLPRGHRADLPARSRCSGRAAGCPHRYRPRRGVPRPARHRRRLEPDRPGPVLDHRVRRSRSRPAHHRHPSAAHRMPGRGHHTAARRGEEPEPSRSGPSPNARRGPAKPAGGPAPSRRHAPRGSYGSTSATPSTGGSRTTSTGRLYFTPHPDRVGYVATARGGDQ